MITLRRRQTALWMCLVYVLVAPAQLGWAQELTFEESIFFPSNGPASDALGFVIDDFNNDGHPDVAALHKAFPGPDTVSIQLNDGSGGLLPAIVQETVDFQAVDTGAPISSADFNDDGHDDLVYALLSIEEPVGSHVYVQFGLGDGTFTDPMAMDNGLVTSFSPTASPADMDGDGDIDIVVSDPDLIFLNDGTGNFPTTVPFPGRACTTNDLDLVDLDGDADIDIVITYSGITCGGNNNDMLVISNNGNLDFEVSAELEHGGATVADDFDLDGDLDLAVTLVFPATGIRIYRNDGAGAFADLGVLATGERGLGAASGDLNGDEFPDLVTAFSALEGELLHAIFVGRGDGTFEPGVPLNTERGGRPGIADLDGDGRQDVLIHDAVLLPTGGNPSGISVNRNITDFGAACEGDANGDGTVNPLDTGFVLARFACSVGAGDANCDAADQNGDGVVDPLDTGFVLARFGECS